MGDGLQFFKWLHGNNEVYPDIVRWIDTREIVTEISCLKRGEIEKMSDHAVDIMERAILWVLFDSGARAEEFLNIRFRHLSVLDGKEGEDTYRIRIEFSKTKRRTILLPIASPYLRRFLESRGERNPEEPIFPIAYATLRKRLARLGHKAVQRKVFPHLLRHSSATHYAPLLSRAAFCYRYGWSYSSNMADRYIDREALSDQESVEAVAAKSTSELIRENTRLREDLSSVRDHLNQIDTFMGILLTDKTLARDLALRVRTHGQGERLNRLRVQAGHAQY